MGRENRRTCSRYTSDHVCVVHRIQFSKSVQHADAHSATLLKRGRDAREDYNNHPTPLSSDTPNNFQTRKRGEFVSECPPCDKFYRRLPEAPARGVYCKKRGKFSTPNNLLSSLLILNRLSVDGDVKTAPKNCVEYTQFVVTISTNRIKLFRSSTQTHSTSPCVGVGRVAAGKSSGQTEAYHTEKRNVKHSFPRLPTAFLRDTLQSE